MLGIAASVKKFLHRPLKGASRADRLPTGTGNLTIRRIQQPHRASTGPGSDEATRQGSGGLTVIVPYWDLDSRLLLEALESLAAQGVPVRTIVLDNDSTIPLPALPAGVEVIRLGRRLNVGEVKNIGLALVETPRVLFLDADDLLPAGALRALLDGLAARPDAVACQGRVVRWRPPETELRPPLTGPLLMVARLLLRHQRALAIVNTWWMLLSLTSTVLDVDTLRRAGGFSEDAAEEDWVLSAVVAFKGPLIFVPAVTRIRRFRPDSLTQRKTRDWRIASNARREMRRRIRQDPDVPRLVRWATPLLVLLHARPTLKRAGQRLLRR
jgi:glycosyltransferase involved in cell wall biosynthesis